jgi:hypothetical protein
MNTFGVSKFKFTYIYDNGTYTDRVVHVREGSLDISELLEMFEHFMRGCSYSFDGHLTIEEDGDSEE